MWVFFNLKHEKIAQKSDYIIQCHVRLYPCCVCVCVSCTVRGLREWVAPETCLQISNSALLKLQSAQSRFQAFTHAEKLHLTYMLPILALLFRALNMSLCFIFAFQDLSFLVFLFFFTLTWNFRLATKYCILRRTFTADLWAWDNLWQKGAHFSLWEG